MAEACQQLRVDLLLDVAREQEPTTGHGAEQDDRHVVDRRCRCPVARAARDRGSATGPRARCRRPPAGRPAARRRLGDGASGQTAAHAAYPGPGPSIPGSNTRPTRYRSSSRASPATWSSCGCDRTTASIRRSHGGIRRSSSTSSRSGSGPPSMSRRPPREPSTRIASPCPTSRTRHRGRRRRPARRRPRPSRTIDDARAMTRAARARPPASDGRVPRASGRATGVGSGDDAAAAGRRRGRRRRHRALPTSSRRRECRDDVDGGSASRSRTAVGRDPSTIATMIRSETQPGAARIAPDQRRRARAPRSRRPAPRRRPPSRGHERDDRKVDRGEIGEPAERGEDDRQRRGLRGERHAEALREPARHVAAPEPIDPAAQRRRPRDETGRRERRQLEACVADQRRVGEAGSADGPAERRRRTARTSATPAPAGRRRPSPPHGRPMATLRRRRRRRRSRPSSAIDRRRRRSRPASAAIAAATIAMFQPEIATTWLTPAVVNAAARSRSTRSRSPIRMPAASPASGSGSTRGERRGGVLPERFRALRPVGRRALHRHRACAERADRPDPFEVVAVRRVGSWPDRALRS